VECLRSRSGAADCVGDFDQTSHIVVDGCATVSVDAHRLQGHTAFGGLGAAIALRAAQPAVAGGLGSESLGRRLETRPENAASHFLAESLVCCLGG
jgi:hypothetical protein